MAICRFQYPAKVICGEFREQGEPLAPGFYVTEINIYNPNEHPVLLRKQLAVAIPPGGQQEGEIYREPEHPLGPGRALAVDCRYLGRLIQPAPGPFFVGFLVVETTDSVAVTAVYTTAGLRTPTAPGIAVEQIRERRIVVEEGR